MSGYPIIELSRTEERVLRWQAVVRTGPEYHEWCCLSRAITKAGATRTARWKHRHHTKPYVPLEISETVPL